MKHYDPVSQKAPYVWHGGDYYPEQWPREVWQEDFRLMREAGHHTATVGVFGWASLQPAEDRFTFEWLDEVMDGLHANGIRVDSGDAERCTTRLDVGRRIRKCCDPTRAACAKNRAGASTTARIHRIIAA